MTDQVEWVTAATATNEFESEILRQRLEAVDVRAVVEPAGARAYMGASSSFTIKVPADELARAKEALDSE